MNKDELEAIAAVCENAKTSVQHLVILNTTLVIENKRLTEALNQTEQIIGRADDAIEAAKDIVNMSNPHSVSIFKELLKRYDEIQNCQVCKHSRLLLKDELCASEYLCKEREECGTDPVVFKSTPVCASFGFRRGVKW